MKRPWENGENWFGLNENDPQFEENNAAFSAIAENVWQAVLTSNRSALMQLAKEFDILVKKNFTASKGNYRSDYQPARRMSEVVKEADKSRDYLDIVGSFIEIYKNYPLQTSGTIHS